MNLRKIIFSTLAGGFALFGAYAFIDSTFLKPDCPYVYNKFTIGHTTKDEISAVFPDCEWKNTKNGIYCTTNSGNPNYKSVDYFVSSKNSKLQIISLDPSSSATAEGIAQSLESEFGAPTAGKLTTNAEKDFGVQKIWWNKHNVCSVTLEVLGNHTGVVPTRVGYVWFKDQI